MREWGVVGNGYGGVSFWSQENVLKLDCGRSCTIL